MTTTTTYHHATPAHCLARRCPFSALVIAGDDDGIDARDGRPGSSRQAGRFSDAIRAARADGRIAEWVAGEIAAMEKIAGEYLAG